MKKGLSNIVTLKCRVLALDKKGFFISRKDTHEAILPQDQWLPGEMLIVLSLEGQGKCLLHILLGEGEGSRFHTEIN